MNRERYIRTLDFFRKNHTAYKALSFVYKLLPLSVFLTYPILLIVSFFCVYDKFWKILLVPACVFGLVTLLRIIFNKQRPYEKYNTDSLFHKTTKGKSMPSRHTASAFVIAMAGLYINNLLGVIMLAVSALIASSRILAGVHYIRDVIVGAGISILSGIVFMFLI